MKKKLLYLNQSRVNQAMLEVSNYNELVNNVFNLLLQFGITDQEAIKNPIEAINSNSNY